MHLFPYSLLYSYLLVTSFQVPSFLSKFSIINSIFSTNYHHYNQIIIYLISRTISTHQTSFSIPYVTIYFSLANMDAFLPPNPTNLSHSGGMLYFSLAFPLLYKIILLPFPSHLATPSSFPFINFIFEMQYLGDRKDQLHSNLQF